MRIQLSCLPLGWSWSSSLPRTSIFQMKKMPTPVTMMRTRIVATGRTKLTTFSPWWATLWAWATSGVFHISPTRTAEVPVLNGSSGWAHLAISKNHEGQPLRLDVFCQSWMWASRWELGWFPLIGMGRAGRSISVLFEYWLRRGIWFSSNCRLPSEYCRTLLTFSSLACTSLSVCQYPLIT